MVVWSLFGRRLVVVWALFGRWLVVVWYVVGWPLFGYLLVIVWSLFGAVRLYLVGIRPWIVPDRPPHMGHLTLQEVAEEAKTSRRTLEALTADALSNPPFNQEHLFHGISPEAKAGLLKQLNDIDKNLPGDGLHGYLERP